MNIIISHNGVKRAISGDGFNICGSGEDLKRVAEQILEAVNSDPRMSYGWIEVRDRIPDKHSAGSGTKPLTWIESGAEGEM
jgi:hypothetical protein